MNRILQLYLISLTLKALEAAFPETAYPCAVCFGAKDSALTLGLNWGIFSLLVVIVSVLGGFAAFFLYLRNRARKTDTTLKTV